MKMRIAGKKFGEATIPPVEAFYSELNLEGISDTDYAHVQKVWKVSEIKTFVEYHNLDAQSDTLLLADVFESFRNICLNDSGLDPTNFLTTDGLAWQAYLKKSKIELEFLADTDMLLIIEKSIRIGICQATHR